MNDPGRGYVQKLLPVFNALFETSLSVAILSREWMVFGGICIALAVGVISGAYSAFFLSSFSPIQAIRGMMNPGTFNAFLRRDLVDDSVIASEALGDPAVKAWD